jgi:hypothetical protein
MKTGIELIRAERQEQIDKHKWDDSKYKNLELEQAANFCFDLAGRSPINTKVSNDWPFGWSEFYKEKIIRKSKVQKLITGGAFLLAENDRRGDNFWVRYLIEFIAKEIDQINHI